MVPIFFGLWLVHIGLWFPVMTRRRRSEISTYNFKPCARTMQEYQKLVIQISAKGLPYDIKNDTNAFYRLNFPDKLHKRDAIYESEVCHMCRSPSWLDFEISSEIIDLNQCLTLSVVNKGFAAGTTPIGECSVILSDSGFKAKEIKLVNGENPDKDVGIIFIKRNLVSKHGTKHVENKQDEIIYKK